MCGNNFTMLWSSFVLYRDVNGSGSAWNQAHRKFAGPEFGPTENFCTEKFYNVIFQASKGTKISNFRGLRPSTPLRGGGLSHPANPQLLSPSLRSVAYTPRFARPKKHLALLRSVTKKFRPTEKHPFTSLIIPVSITHDLWLSVRSHLGANLPFGTVSLVTVKYFLKCR